MALIIIIIVLLGYLLIATESVTNANKAAVAIFAGTLGWVLYVAYGTDFVMNLHQQDYMNFLAGSNSTSGTVKEYIAQNVFLKYVGNAAEIVLFLLATMTIVEILNNNGCFDFITQLLHTRHSKRMLWALSVTTFVISANLDNLTTTIMMLTIMHKVIPSRKLRLIYGSAIVLAANCGGAFTVIGDPTGLLLWNNGAVTATNYSMSLLLPCLIAWLFPTLLLYRMLPERIETEWVTMPYRGDDTNLNVWQRLLMLVVGIGGLWFIPSFHSITKLSPFVGALCVLSVLWIVHELFNRKLIKSDTMIHRQMPRKLQYGVLQMMLFVMGIMLSIGVVNETGAINTLSQHIDNEIHNVWIMGLISGTIGTVLDNFATAAGMFSLHSVIHSSSILNGIDADYMQNFAQNGMYWKIIAYTSAIGGNILPIGSMAGLALMASERVHVGWYFRNIGWKAMIGGIIGLAVMWLISA